VQLERQDIQRAKAGERDQGPPQIPPEFMLAVSMPNRGAVLRLSALAAPRVTLVRSSHFHLRFPPMNHLTYSTTQLAWIYSGMTCAMVSAIAARDTIATTT
jgi:hypothetical protein